MVQNHGGSEGVRNMNMLDSAINRPFATFAGSDLYTDIYLKGGALIQSIIKNHPFVDGNKRTAFSSCYVFLKKNKIKITAEENEVVEFMSDVANKSISVDEIGSWLKSHSKKT